MKISLNWLNDFIDLGDLNSKPDEISRLLTQAGLEVDEVADRAKDFAQVVVGQVEVLDKHPQADRLTLCQVNAGEKDLRQIICGAKNHKQGDKVVVALPGAVLPGDFAIKKSKIRGVESHGMLCSAKELGLGEDHEGIIVLPEDAPVGASFADYRGLSDVIFEINVTPNRADCLSHLGLARELSALLDKEFTMPSMDFKAGDHSIKNSIQLDHKDSEFCPRYAGRGVAGVKVGESPSWLKQRLEAVGVNTINNIVDVTNYVMFELGQPLHAFDVRFLEGQKILIDRSQGGEKFVTLDGTEVELTGQELMIRDGKKPVAMAGVIGGKNSGVEDTTGEIFIESAHFTPSSVRKSSRRHGIETDSAYRFSRGTDPDMVESAMNRASFLIQQVAGGQVSSDFYDSYPKPHQAQAISIRLDYLQERLGYPATASEFLSWMKRLGCQVEESSGTFKVIPPLYRWDLHHDVDLVEEYARLHGYDHIPETLPPQESSPSAHVKDYQIAEDIELSMRRQGYHQAVNYAFISQQFFADFIGKAQPQKQWGVSLDAEAVQIQNPLSDDLNVMRVSLIPGLIKNFLHNYRHGREFGKLFEMGPVVFKENAETIQQSRLSLMSWGQSKGLWDQHANQEAVFDVKSALEGLLSNLHCSGYQWRAFKSGEAPEFLHPGQCATLFFEGKTIGLIGSLHPAWCMGQKIRHSVAVAEIDTAALLRSHPRKPRVKPISKYPAVQRDFAFVLPTSLAVSEVIKTITKAGGDRVQTVEVFDRFQGKDLTPDQWSVSFRVTYQSMQQTLEEEEITQLHQSLIQSVQKKHQVEIR